MIYSGKIFFSLSMFQLEGKGLSGLVCVCVHYICRYIIRRFREWEEVGVLIALYTQLACRKTDIVAWGRLHASASLESRSFKCDCLVVLSLGPVIQKNGQR